MHCIGKGIETFHDSRIKGGWKIVGKGLEWFNMVIISGEKGRGCVYTLRVSLLYAEICVCMYVCVFVCA